MFQKLKNSPAVLLLLGMVFLIIGIAGVVYVNKPLIEVADNSRYRYFEKNWQSESILYFPIPDIIEAPQNPSTLEAQERINPGQTYIHDPLNPELEEPKIPDKLEIPTINLTAPVMVSDYNKTKVEGETFGQWVAPSKFAAGWHPDSALLGQTGNVVINGHHNEFGMVFGELINLEVGDIIKVYFGEEEYTYVISNKLILPERFQETEVRLENARWLGKTSDTRLTLVTCWPKESNTHRLIIVARPY